ncbi:hypothetical protein DYB37_013092 [Aphanomyces astaci]|uniref:Uncharacterized protein n=1 Tax=Aphanomyces astaci TaxID=112090 RepID=A0A3R7C4R1_APHAT|nr:hypothetical protein DYB35_011376 [Aphanomyces astaci]RHZ33480.1 hypothetical protein DYB37_013092 [Aphanomyces astaci]
MEFVPAQPQIIPEGPALSREEMVVFDVELNPHPFQPLDDPEVLQDEIDFVEGVLDNIDLHPTLEPYPFQPLENIHRSFLKIPSKMRFKCGLHAETLRMAILRGNLPCCLKGKVKMDPYVFPDSPEMQAFKDLFKQHNFFI